MVFEVRSAPNGEPYELSDILEKAKKKAGNQIIKKSGERWPPFYVECYDRIVRDEAEYEETWQKILASPVDNELAEDPEEYRQLFVADNPNS